MAGSLLGVRTSILLRPETGGQASARDGRANRLSERVGLCGQIIFDLFVGHGLHTCPQEKVAQWILCKVREKFWSYCRDFHSAGRSWRVRRVATTFRQLRKTPPEKHEIVCSISRCASC